MGAEAGVDEGELLRLRIVHRQLALVGIERGGLGVGIIRALAAERRRAGRVIGSRHPDIAFGVHHVVVIVEFGVPNLLHAPIGRGRQRLFDGGVARTESLRHIGAFRGRDVGDLVGLRIEHRLVVGSVFRRAIQRTVGIDGRIALIARDQVVEIFVGSAPIPFRDHDIALDALRPLRLGKRQRAIGDAVRPLAEIFERHAAEFAGEHIDHQWRRLTGLHAPFPGLFAVLELAQCRGNGPRRQLAELMAADAGLVLQRSQPVDLRDIIRNVALAAELVLTGIFSIANQ